MAKARHNFLLSPNTIHLLQKLSDQEGRAMGRIIEDALAIYGKPDDELSRHLLQVYESVSDAIIFLQNRRDYPNEGEGWTEEESELHSLLEPLWDKLRKHPKFWEPTINE